MNLPNKLTMLRIFLIPVFIVFASIKEIPYHFLWAGIVFAFASFTDFLDGSIARKYNLVTDFGKFADPLADKLLTTVAFIYMMVDGVCHPVVLVIILAREFAVSGVRMVAAGSKTGKVIAANIWGKVKTVIQMLTIIYYYAAAGLLDLFSGNLKTGVFIIYSTQVLCWVVAGITLLSGIQYIWGNREYINTAK
ncbi:CDP-diacylglycerol--glycerol-3-phosphate 3-phosphatidyltransferase [Ruminococcaceae bacterium OttesenSCG-928-I18]|nr:CDP-diacylglycerol--glycerol-3-phosphate 3-phosphatidyltransferase [Ruminococcaceae bacterium OttesenSCG-928-I18]